jgi:hypothetical protein
MHGDDRVSDAHASQHCDICHSGSSGFGGNLDSAEIVIGAPKCEVAHTSLPIRPSKVRHSDIYPARQEGYMAPKAKPARFVFAVGMLFSITILAVMTWAMAQPSLSPIYHPQLLLLY